MIQPLVPQRLPCYDFIPITTHTLGDGFHDVTGGVYKARERIHGVVADTPLLANPTSWSRVADSNLNWGRFSRGSLRLAAWHPSVPAIVARVQPWM